MNNNVQIRIWANYKDFADATENIPLRILPENYSSLFKPDSFRYIACDHYHSFLYTPDAICINFHTLVQSNKLRDARVVITLAIRRGFRMEQHPADVLNAIRKAFIDFINDKSQFFEEYNVNGIEDKIKSPVEEWEDKIQTTQHIEQILLNRSVTSQEIAFVAFENNDAFRNLLQYPDSMAYNGYRIVFVVPSDNKIAFSNNNYTDLSTSVSASAQPVYNIYLTAYSTTSPIATIKSISDPIEVRKEKTYYKPLTLKGSIKDNWEAWKVSRNADGISFNIGIPFEMESKVYKLDFNKLLDPFTKLVFSWGVPNITTGSLIVTGEELGKTIGLNLVSARTEQIAIQSVTCTADTINIQWKERFAYSIPELINHIQHEYGFSPKLSIVSKWVRQGELLDSKQWWDGKREDYKIIIRDNSGKYADYECDMSLPIIQIKLEKVSGIKVKFYWRDTIHVDEEHPIVFYGPKQEEKRITRLGDTLEFFNTASYRIELDGYDPLNYKVTKKSSEDAEYLFFRSKSNRKIKRYIILGIIGLVLLLGGCAGGFFLGKIVIVNPNPNPEPKITEKELPSVQEAQESINTEAMNAIKKELQDSVAVLSNLRQTLKTKDQELKSAKKDLKDAKNVQKTLVLERFNTLIYTKEDVVKVKTFELSNEEKAKINACEAVLNACNMGRNKLSGFSQIDKTNLPQASKEGIEKIQSKQDALKSNKNSYNCLGELVAAIMAIPQ